MAARFLWHYVRRLRILRPFREGLVDWSARQHFLVLLLILRLLRSSGRWLCVPPSHRGG